MFNYELVFVVTINELDHKLLQRFIFIKQIATENNIGYVISLKFNNNYSKGLKKNSNYKCNKKFQIFIRITLLPLHKEIQINLSNCLEI